MTDLDPMAFEITEGATGYFLCRDERALKSLEVTRPAAYRVLVERLDEREALRSLSH